jgi:cytidyltransferase-like protein
MKTIFVSGCYDILHAGHLQFFADARALGEHLTVCFASAEVLWAHKQRQSSLPDEHKRAVLEALSMVDHVVMGTGTRMGLDFEEHFLRLQPRVLAVTEDDQYADAKRELCDRVGAEYRTLKKSPPNFPPVTTSELVRWIRAPRKAPLRVDFAGGWLDLPQRARPGEFVVNCAITPLVSLNHWPYERYAGLGGSGAFALLDGQDGVAAELAQGSGWQDAAAISETGLCVWRSGPRPVLEFKRGGDMLAGRMALVWTGQPHHTPDLIDRPRDYDRIAVAARLARAAVLDEDFTQLAEAVRLSYEVQLAEGMSPLVDVPTSAARKYCGSGWGGYSVCLFDESTDRDAFVASEPAAMTIEPYIHTNA